MKRHSPSLYLLPAATPSAARSADEFAPSSSGRFVERSERGMHVNELARCSGLPAHVVRYYARIGLLRPGRDPGNGYRVFGRRDVTRLCIIDCCRRLGLSLAEIAALLETAAIGPTSLRHLYTVLGRHAEDNRTRLHALLAVQRNLDRALAGWDGLPGIAADMESLKRTLETLTENRADA